MERDCTTCEHAEFEKSESGRRRLYSAKCTVDVKIPHSMRDYRDELPKKRTVGKYTLANCPLWKKDER